jgi:CubicO group peptidase (beta-lactamase class C family)
MTYFPPPGSAWKTVSPEQAGLDPKRLADAVTFAENAETSWPRALDRAEFLPSLTQHEPPPWNEILGPVAPRGGPAGLFLRGGRIAAQWGDPARADMTFSIAKSYLAVLAGLAVGEGLIDDLDDTVAGYVEGDWFASEQNAPITWRQLLNQTSEWEGTLFSKPDQVDHFRELGHNSDHTKKGKKRDLQAPGTYWEYNDVRVNMLSLALMYVFRHPLPEVLRDSIMAPIGASDTWRWMGYRNSQVTIDGVEMTSVPGGTHWGGGMQISSLDHARFGLLIKEDGVWNGHRILPEGWVEALRTPCPLNPEYGFLWWLNTDRAHYPSAPETSFFAMGAGASLIWIDQELDILAVFRWVDQASLDPVISGFMAAME